MACLGGKKNDRKQQKKKREDAGPDDSPSGGGSSSGGCDCGDACLLNLVLHLRILAATACAALGVGRTVRTLGRQPGAPTGFLARRVHLAVRYYQVRISPRYPARCRYTPTCSEYAATAVHRHGAARGGMLALRRLARCRPNGGRGVDPVPGH